MGEGEEESERDRKSDRDLKGNKVKKGRNKVARVYIERVNYIQTK